MLKSYSLEDRVDEISLLTEEDILRNQKELEEKTKEFNLLNTFNFIEDQNKLIEILKNTNKSIEEEKDKEISKLNNKLSKKGKEISDLKNKIEDLESTITFNNTIEEKLILDIDKDKSYYKGEGKTVYLTFDDGPSARTLEILKILDEYNAKATFFHCSGMYRDLIESKGHKFGMHSNSHNYKYIYRDLESFKDDYYTLKSSVGESDIFRFPGGSNTSFIDKYGGIYLRNRIKEFLNSEKVQFYDWNISSLDTKVNNPLLIEEAIKKQIKGKNSAVILFHDSYSKKHTVEALPNVLQHLSDQGYAFKKISTDEIGLQFKIN